MTTIVIPERRENERYRSEYLEPTAEAQTFQTPYSVTKVGRFTVLIDRSLPGVRYGFCLEADPLGRPVPDVLCWASPYTPTERAEKSAQAAEVCKRFEGNDLEMTEAESLEYARLVHGRVSLTVEDTLTAHREAELRLGSTPPAHLQALTPIERIGLHYLDFPGGSREK